jgi:mono/diheme cytochrome c family protein
MKFSGKHILYAVGLIALPVMIVLTPAEDTAGPAVVDTTAPAGMVKVALPENLTEEAVIGKRAFDAACASCHGANAAGQDGVAPPLVHKIYEPSHHGDATFHRAAQQGVKAHHWSFGDMPPVEGLTQSDVDAIVAYVRELQRHNGIK